jgi:2-oxo-3-hexenedioate decarboxylase
MPTLTAAPDLSAIADEVLASLSGHCQIPTFSSRDGGLTLDQAYQVTGLVRAAFETRGEKIVGRKIGFTNREMWKVYGVQSPIWGYVTDRSIHHLADKSVLRVENFVEARIEPEIIFRLEVRGRGHGRCQRRPWSAFDRDPACDGAAQKRMAARTRDFWR